MKRAIVFAITLSLGCATVKQEGKAAQVLASAGSWVKVETDIECRVACLLNPDAVSPGTMAVQCRRISDHANAVTRPLGECP